LEPKGSFPFLREKIDMKYRETSKFFEIAEEMVTPKEDLLPGLVKSTVREESFEQINLLKSPDYTSDRSKSKVLTGEMNLRKIYKDWPENVPNPKIVSLATEEGLSLSVGRWTVKPDGISFLPSRLDLGIPAQIDLATLTEYLVQTKEFREILTEADGHLEKHLAVTNLISDPKVNLQDAIYFLTGKTVVSTQLHIRHQKDDNPENPYGRVAVACNLRDEGIDAKCEYVCLCDAVAGGLQIVMAMEAYEKSLKIKNDGSHCLKHFVIFAPICSLSGAAVISIRAAMMGIRITFFGSAGSMLHAMPPDRYMCPFYYGDGAEHLTPEPAVMKIQEYIFGDAKDKVCLWCNWGAKRFAPWQALKDSQDELKSYGLSNEEVLSRAKTLMPGQVKKFGIDPSKLVSTATIYEAVKFGKLEELHKFLKK